MHKDPFYKSLGYAISGIIQCIQKERNIKIHLVFMFLVITCGFLFQLSITEWSCKWNPRNSLCLFYLSIPFLN